MYGISRVDDDLHRYHGWRVSLRRKGRRIVKSFPDARFGGSDGALMSAMKCRDELVKAHPPLTRMEFADAARRNNTSGIVGVCLVIDRRITRQGKVRYRRLWEAVWPTTPGENVKRRFSVSKYGEECAFKMACEARREGLKQVEGVFWPALDRAGSSQPMLNRLDNRNCRAEKLRDQRL